jgi:[acyl-carrier-protein] S-malonyltransferase
LNILEQALKDGNKEVVSMLNKPTETALFKTYLARSEDEKKITGPQYSETGISVPGIPGGMVIPVDTQDPLQAMRQYVRKQVSKNTGMRQQDVKFSGEKVQAPKKKAPAKKKPLYEMEKPSPPVEKQAPPPVPQKSQASATNIALMFPGQGSQYVKMLSEIQTNQKVKEYIETANRILGYDILEKCLEGPESALEETSVCQPAMFLAGMAGLERLKEVKPEAYEKPACMAGLSLGEYTALCASGVFTFEDGMEFVKVRGAAMSEAASVSQQGMLSVAGLSREEVDNLCKAVSVDGELAQVANVLFPKGFSCAGSKEAIKKLEGNARDAGALQAKMLKTSGAFHTPMMAPARAKLEAKLQEMLPRMKPPTCDLYMNRTGLKVPKGTPPTDIVSLLGEQLTNPVLWHDSVEKMISDGMTEFYEVGPMKQLKAMMKRINPDVWKNTTNIDV